MQLIFNTPQETIQKRFADVDILCTDLDECLFPFFTQVLVAAEILVESIFKRNKWKYIPQLVFGALYICSLYILTFGNIRILRNEFLMDSFSRTMKKIPLHLIRKHARYVHTFFYTDSLSFLQKISKRGVPIVILSLSLQPILDELIENIGFIDEGIGNEINFSADAQLFQGYSDPLMSNASHKLEAFLKMKERRGCQTPLIIGHSEDEMLLVEYAREVGGVSIGINPKKHLASKFDIVLNSVNWLPLVNFLDGLEKGSD